MWPRRRKTESKNIQEFVDILYRHWSEHPDDLCPPGIDPQLALHCLCDVFLGEDYYITMLVSGRQANAVILNNILLQHSPEYRRLITEKGKLHAWTYKQTRELSKIFSHDKEQ